MKMNRRESLAEFQRRLQQEKLHRELSDDLLRAGIQDREEAEASSLKFTFGGEWLEEQANNPSE